MTQPTDHSTVQEPSQTSATELQQARQQIALLKETVARLQTDQMNLSNELMAKNRLLGEIVVRDEMTGLYNRPLLTQRAQEEIERSSRYGTALSLMFFRLDQFRRLQDAFGYETGDQVLVRIANTVAAHIRKPDILARWDNDTFAILMPHTTLESGMRSAERMRRVIADMPHPDVGPVTGSFGVAEREKNEPHTLWLKNVDRAMQKAMLEGGNLVRGQEGSSLRDPVAMVRFTWRTEWNSGNRMIDRQHRELIEIANDLMDMVLTETNLNAVHSAMDNLLAHIQHHFWDEERILQRLGYVDVASHAQCHVDLLEEASRFEERYLGGTIKPTSLFAFLIDTVIMGHMLKEDVRYFGMTRAASPDVEAEAD